MYKYVLNYVVKISMMFVKYFKYYTIILMGRFSWTRCTIPCIERVQTLAHILRSALCCHSNETHAPIANLPNSVQLEGTPYPSPTYICVRAVVWECSKRQTDRQTHRRPWPVYISPRLHLTWNVIMPLRHEYMCVWNVCHSCSDESECTQGAFFIENQNPLWRYRLWRWWSNTTVKNSSISSLIRVR